MKCPIPFVTLAEDSFPPLYERNDCLKEECAWWQKNLEMCAIAVQGYLSGLEIERKEMGRDDD